MGRSLPLPSKCICWSGVPPHSCALHFKRKIVLKVRIDVNRSVSPMTAAKWRPGAKWARALHFSVVLSLRSSLAFSSSLVPIKHGLVTSGKHSLYVSYSYWGCLAIVDVLRSLALFWDSVGGGDGKKQLLTFPVLARMSLCSMTLPLLWSRPGTHLSTLRSWAWPQDLLWLMRVGECARNRDLTCCWEPLGQPSSKLILACWRMSDHMVGGAQLWEQGHCQSVDQMNCSSDLQNQKSFIVWATKFWVGFYTASANREAKA